MQSVSRRCSAAFIHLSRLSSTRTRTISIQCLPKIVYHSPYSAILMQTAKMHTARRLKAAAAAVESPVESAEEDGTITRFEDLARHGLIHATVVATITRTMKLETMTPVQSQTINQALQGVDTLALARTGTGKTVAFLLPVIQRILEANPMLEHKQRTGTIDIQSIIISPTRELAEQIAQEARKMVSNTGIEVGLAVGGTGRSNALREMKRYGCQILVGTPGRLNDLLSDPSTPVKAPRLNSLVLDEADRLLDDGFGPAIEEIYRYLPSKLQVDRQTFMFSATMAKEVLGLVSRFMKPDYSTVQTVAAGEIQTHERVPQFSVALAGLENQIPALFELIKQGNLEQENFKAIVFCNTAADAILSQSIFNNSNLSQKLGMQALQMHARLSQNQRTRTSDNFRRSKKAIMFASDVAARGMDFPSVTHVVQMGLPKDRDTYIHRIGRTGRAGKEGQGWVLLTPWDQQMVKTKLKDLPVKKDTSLQTASIDMSQSHSILQGAADILTDAIQAAKSVDFDTKATAFRSNLSVGATVSKVVLIESLNRQSKYTWGLDPPPAMSYALAQKLGFSKVSQLNIGHDPRASSRVDELDSRSSFTPKTRTDTRNGSRNGSTPDRRQRPASDRSGERLAQPRSDGRSSYGPSSRSIGDSSDRPRPSYDSNSRGGRDSGDRPRTRDNHGHSGYAGLTSRSRREGGERPRSTSNSNARGGREGGDRPQTRQRTEF